MDIKASLRITCITSLIATASVILAYKCIYHYCQELLKTVNCKMFFFQTLLLVIIFFSQKCVSFSAKTTKKEKIIKSNK